MATPNSLKHFFKVFDGDDEVVTIFEECSSSAQEESLQ